MTTESPDGKKVKSKSNYAMLLPISTGQVTCVTYIKALQKLAFGSEDGFFSFIEITADDVSSLKSFKISARKVESFRLKSDNNVTDIKGFFKELDQERVLNYLILTPMNLYLIETKEAQSLAGKPIQIEIIN